MHFDDACHDHLTVETAFKGSPDRARETWDALANDVSALGSFYEAIRDTMAPEHGAIMSDPVAVAFAFDTFFPLAGNAARQDRGTVHRDRARAGWKTFAERVEEAEQLAQHFGWTLCAAWKVLREVNAAGGSMYRVQQVAKLAGRMYAELKGARARQVNGIPGEVHSVEQGRDVGRLLPSEQVLLMDDQLEVTVLERIATGRALQFAVRGTAPASKGPIVMVLDESSSMDGPRNIFAKAAAVAVTRVAAAERRPVAVVHYSTSVVRRADCLEPTALIEMVRHFLQGGTDTPRALGAARELVQQLARKGKIGADVILVTDGVDHNLAGITAAIDALDRIGARLWTVAIECAIATVHPLRARAAGYVELTDKVMTDPKTVTVFAPAI